MSSPVPMLNASYTGIFADVIMPSLTHARTQASTHATEREEGGGRMRINEDL